MPQFGYDVPEIPLFFMYKGKPLSKLSIKILDDSAQSNDDI